MGSGEQIDVQVCYFRRILFRVENVTRVTGEQRVPTKGFDLPPFHVAAVMRV